MEANQLSHALRGDRSVKRELPQRVPQTVRDLAPARDGDVLVPARGALGNRQRPEVHAPSHERRELIHAEVLPVVLGGNRRGRGAGEAADAGVRRGLRVECPYERTSGWS